jgi:hypothetical protein
VKDRLLASGPLVAYPARCEAAGAILPHRGDAYAQRCLSTWARPGATSGPYQLTPFRHARDRGTRPPRRRLFGTGRGWVWHPGS